MQIKMEISFNIHKLWGYMEIKTKLLYAYIYNNFEM